MYSIGSTAMQLNATVESTIPVNPELPKTLLSLMGDYASMLMVLQDTDLCEEKFHKLKLFLSGICDDVNLQACSSFNGVVQLLKENSRIYIFNIDILQFCYTRQELLIEGNARLVVEQYHQQLENFLSSTSVLELEDCVHSIRHPENLERIVLKLNRTTAKDTLRYLKKLVYLFFGDTSKTLILHKIRRGCVCVTWFVPTSLVPTLKEKAEMSLEYLASEHVHIEFENGLQIGYNKG